MKGENKGKGRKEKKWERKEGEEKEREEKEREEKEREKERKKERKNNKRAYWQKCRRSKKNLFCLLIPLHFFCASLYNRVQGHKENHTIAPCLDRVQKGE
jgi:hypothetical protein